MWWRFKNNFNKYKSNDSILNIINKIFIQLNNELKAMRLKNYIHTKLKSENILIKYNEYNKIILLNIKYVILNF